MVRRLRVALTIFMVAAVLTGCVQDAPVSAARPSASAGPTNAPRLLTFPLKSQVGRATGVVNVNVGPTSYEVRVVLSHLVPGASYLLNLHNGSCALEDTSVIIDMGSFRADDSGTATHTRTFQGVPIPAAGRIVTLHGPLNTDDARTHVACGDMTG